MIEKREGYIEVQCWPMPVMRADAVVKAYYRIPEAERGSALLTLSDSTDDDDNYVQYLHLEFRRELTEAEVLDRARRKAEAEARRAAAIEQEERDRLAALLAKYGPPNG